METVERRPTNKKYQIAPQLTHTQARGVRIKDFTIFPFTKRNLIKHAFILFMTKLFPTRTFDLRLRMAKKRNVKRKFSF